MQDCSPVCPKPKTLRLLLQTVPQCAAAGHSESQHGSAACGGFRAVPVEHASQLSYDNFVSQYMAPNTPVLIRVSVLYAQCSAVRACMLQGPLPLPCL